MIFLAYAAPFGVFRDFTAGYFRSSFPVAPPSSLYGLILNLAGIEMRGELGPGPTETRPGLPKFRVANALPEAKVTCHSYAELAGNGRRPGRAMLFQQLHTIPVGSSSKERKPLTKGNKHHIAPARREVLTQLRGVCAIDTDTDFEKRLERQLELPESHLLDGSPRYGLPFLGDNNFFLEELSIVSPSTLPVDWVVRVQEEDVEELGDGLDALWNPAPEDSFPFRLTIWADRTGMKNTRDAMFATRSGTLDSIPDDAWVEVGPL